MRMSATKITPILTVLLAGLQIAGCGGAVASRARTRYVVQHGVLPRPEEIRVEEYLADYRESLPNPGPSAAGLTVEGARAAWAAESSEPLLVVQTAIRGRDADTRPPMALMFVVDRSGSMNEQDKMTYVREALHRLVGQLDPRDHVGITSFDDMAQLELAPTPLAKPLGKEIKQIERNKDWKDVIQGVKREIAAEELWEKVSEALAEGKDKAAERHAKTLLRKYGDTPAAGLARDRFPHLVEGDGARSLGAR